MCLIQFKSVDFNSTQFNAFGVEFEAFNAIQCVFELRQIPRFEAFNAIQCVFELRRIDTKRR